MFRRIWRINHKNYIVIGRIYVNKIILDSDSFLIEKIPFKSLIENIRCYDYSIFFQKYWSHSEETWIKLAFNTGHCSNNYVFNIA